MNCQHCGKELPENRTYCTGCGARILSESERQYNALKKQHELPYEQRIKKKSPNDYIAIAIGVFLIYLSIKGSAFLALFGFICISAGLFDPKKTNYCENCKAGKDISAKSCPHCGRLFSIPAGNIAAGIAVTMIAMAVYLMVTL